MQLRRATIVYNPKSGRKSQRERSVERMVRLLAVRGISADAKPTTGPDQAGELARDAAKLADVIIGYGGDGTLNEIIQGLAGASTPLAIWPGGTANVAARDIGMPGRLETLADIIAEGKTKSISLGLATAPESGKPGRYFLMFAGIGLDASICRGVNPELKGRTGQFAFVVSGLRHIARFRPQRFTVQAEGQTFESEFTLVANGKGYGGRIQMANTARLEDPWFELFIIPWGRGRTGLVSDLMACQMGRREKSSATVLKACRVLANVNSDAWVEVDGEVLGPLPMEFTVTPNALQIIIP